MKRRFSFLLALILILPLVVSCKKNKDETGSEQTKTIKITVNGTSIDASLNTDSPDGAVIYDRNYVNDSIMLNEQHSGRDVFLVKQSENDSEYKISGKSKDRNTNVIPYNGFLISVEKDSLTAASKNVVTVEGYQPSESESTAFGKFSIGENERRIYLRDPESLPNENVIVLITPETKKDTAVTSEMSAFLLSKISETSFSIGDKTELIPSGSYAIVFCGKYNKAYANYYMKKGEYMNISKTDMVYKDFYKPVIKINGENKEINGINANAGNDGIYLYDTFYSEISTPDTDSVCLIISNDKVIYKAEKGVIVPTQDAYALVFSSSAKQYAKDFDIGDSVEILLADVKTIKNTKKGIDLQYKLSTIPYTQYNGVRYTDFLVIYNSGEKTGTNPYGYEISVGADGKMISESYSGDMAIPKGGYVLSGHGKSQEALVAMYAYCAEVRINDNDKTVSVITTPLTQNDNIKGLYSSLKSQYDTQVESYKDFDYTGADQKLNSIKTNLSEIDTFIGQKDFLKALTLLSQTKKQLDESKFVNFSDKAAENRAAWYAPKETSEQQVIETVKTMKKLNLNALYIETWRNGETIYPTNVKWARQSKSYNGFDVLEAFVRIGHENGIEIHCWVENFFIGTDVYLSDPDHIVSKTKGLHVLSRKGEAYNPTIYGNFVFLNPNSRECRDFVLEVYKEIMTKYDIDGLHLDYIRFPEPNDISEQNRNDFGYNDDIIKAFQKKYRTKVDPHTIYPNSPLWEDWCKFREDIISSFVVEIYDLVNKVKPDTWISCAVFPNLDTSPTMIFQNCKTWIDEGMMDEVFAMAYFANVDLVVENTKEFVKTVGQQSFYSVGLGAFMEYNENTYINQIEGTRNLFVDGTAMFSLASIKGNHLLEYISSSVHRKSSVQTYKLEKTLSAQLDSLIKRCDGIFTLSKASASQLTELKNKLSEIKALCSEFKSENATNEQKLDFIKNVKAALEKIDISAIEAADSKLGSVLKTEIEECLDCLVKSQYRIECKIKAVNKK